MIVYKEQKKKEKERHKDQGKRSKISMFKVRNVLYWGKLGKTSCVIQISAQERNQYHPSRFVRLRGTCPSRLAGDGELCGPGADEFKFLRHSQL